VDLQPTLVIVCGLPGSGKTTHSRSVANDLRAIRFSPDEWMESLNINIWDADSRGLIEALQLELAKELLQVGQSVVIEWGTWARIERDALREEGRDLGAIVELHYLDDDIDVLWHRIQSRDAESPPIKREDLESWLEVFEAPDDEELALFDRVYRSSD
jgi:predicted kinase